MASSPFFIAITSPLRGCSEAHIDAHTSTLDNRAASATHRGCKTTSQSTHSAPISMCMTAVVRAREHIDAAHGIQEAIVYAFRPHSAGVPPPAVTKTAPGTAIDAIALAAHGRSASCAAHRTQGRRLTTCSRTLQMKINAHYTPKRAAPVAAAPKNASGPGDHAAAGPINASSTSQRPPKTHIMSQR